MVRLPAELPTVRQGLSNPNPLSHATLELQTSRAPALSYILMLSLTLAYSYSDQHCGVALHELTWAAPSLCLAPSTGTTRADTAMQPTVRPPGLTRGSVRTSLVRMSADHAPTGATSRGSRATPSRRGPAAVPAAVSRYINRRGACRGRQ